MSIIDYPNRSFWWLFVLERVREWEFQIWSWCSSVGPEVAPLFTNSFECKKKIKSWQVCDWLAKWLIMSGYMDLRRPRVYRRSNVGLVSLAEDGVVEPGDLPNPESFPFSVNSPDPVLIRRGKNEWFGMEFIGKESTYMNISISVLDELTWKV